MHKLIACSVFKKFIQDVIPEEEAQKFDITYLPMSNHNDAKIMRENLQEEIDLADDKSFEAIVLLYGICGNGTVGLKAGQTPLIIPRMHDCCTLFLGNKQTYQEQFSQIPSMSWNNVYYYREQKECYDDCEIEDTHTEHLRQNYIEKYGEDNGIFLYEMMVDQSGPQPFLFINFDDPENQAIKEKLTINQSEIREISGSSTLLKHLFQANWTDDKFLTIRPNHTIQASYDYDQVLYESE